MYLKVCGLSILAIAPRPNVVAVKRRNPIIIAFLAPSLFLIMALNGAKIIYATENIDKIRDTSSDSKVASSSETHL